MGNKDDEGCLTYESGVTPPLPPSSPPLPPSSPPYYYGESSTSRCLPLCVSSAAPPPPLSSMKSPCCHPPLPPHFFLHPHSLLPLVSSLPPLIFCAPSDLSSLQVLWEVLNFAVLAAVCIICCPSDNSKRLSYASQLPTDDPGALHASLLSFSPCCRCFPDPPFLF